MTSDCAVSRLISLVYLKRILRLKNIKYIHHKPMSHTRIELWIMQGMLQLYMIVPTRLCPDSIVPIHNCTLVCSCLNTNCGQTRSCPRTIINVSTRLYVNFIGVKIVNTSILKYCWRSEMWLFNYCSAITSSITSEIFRHLIFQLKYSCSSMIMARIVIIMHKSTVVSGHKLTCLDTNVWSPFGI